MHERHHTLLIARFDNRPLHKDIMSQGCKELKIFCKNHSSFLLVCHRQYVC